MGLAALAGAMGVANAGCTVAGSGRASEAERFTYAPGTDRQFINGTRLSEIAYGFTDPSNRAIDMATLTFTDAVAAGTTPTIRFSADRPVSFTCTPVVSGSSTCTPKINGQSQTGATSILVTP